jgi:hypothetical protein
MGQAVNDYTSWLLRHEGISRDSTWFSFVGSSLRRIVPSNALLHAEKLDGEFAGIGRTNLNPAAWTVVSVQE